MASRPRLSRCSTPVERCSAKEGALATPCCSPTSWPERPNTLHSTPMVPVWLAVLAAAIDPSPGAQLLERAERELSELKYTQALVTLNALEASRDLTRAQVVRALVVAGRVKAALGRQAEARDAFVRLLEVEQGYRLEGRASPKITSPFYEAKALARPLRLELGASSRDGRWAEVTVTLSGNLARVKRVRLRIDEDGAARELLLEARASQRFALSARKGQVVASLEDSNGWVLAEAIHTLDELPVAAPVALEPKPAPTLDSRVVAVEVAPAKVARLRPLAFGLFAAGVASAGAGLGAWVKGANSRAELVRAISGSSDGVLPLARSRAEALNGEVRDFGLAAGVVWTIAAALAIAGVVIFIAGAP
ncbi:MAG: hypothetical protein JNK82_43665 [Myxococcaceae bacterium]|nr:hypothetical protein [Myxococcaceae bacterium]